jgi:hypothetical protein
MDPARPGRGSLLPAGLAPTRLHGDEQLDSPRATRLEFVRCNGRGKSGEGRSLGRLPITDE